MIHSVDIKKDNHLLMEKNKQKHLGISNEQVSVWIQTPMTDYLLYDMIYGGTITH